MWRGQGKVRVGRPQTSKQRVSDAGEAAVADSWTLSKESKANHHVQNCPWSRCSATFISYPSGSTHQMQPPAQVQVHLGVHNCIHGIFLSPKNSPVKRTWQRNCRGDFHQLLQKSSALVRRRRSSTWYPTSGVCRLRSRSRSPTWGERFEESDQQWEMVSQNFVFVRGFVAVGAMWWSTKEGQSAEHYSKTNCYDDGIGLRSLSNHSLIIVWDMHVLITSVYIIGTSTHISDRWPKQSDSESFLL